MTQGDDDAVVEWPQFGDEELAAVTRVLRSGRVNQWTGPEVGSFEREFASFCEVPYALAVTNGTVALEAALAVLDLEPGDEVVVTPRSFIASAACVLRFGAVPVFADVDRDSELITPATVEPCITERTRAIVCVHLAGWPCDMDGFRALVHGRDITLIEDCAQAHGARYKGRPVGGLGDLAAWSFCQDKIMTTGGEGGMVTTTRADLYRRLWSYRDHGKDGDAALEPAEGGGYRWLHRSVGTNARMTSMQAAIGRVQLGRVPGWHARREEIARRIREAGDRSMALRVPVLPGTIEHAWYRCDLFLEPEHLGSGWSRDRILAELRSNGVTCLPGPCSELYRERVFQTRGIGPKEPLPNAVELGETCLMFLVHPTQTDEQVGRTVGALERVLDRAGTG